MWTGPCGTLLPLVVVTLGQGHHHPVLPRTPVLEKAVAVPGPWVTRLAPSRPHRARSCFITKTLTHHAGKASGRTGHSSDP